MKAFQEFLDEGVNDPAIFKAIILLSLVYNLLDMFIIVNKIHILQQ